jgi:thiol-disulfide isomerase/thioredoxin
VSKTGIVIRDMTEDDEYYVGTCTHVNETNKERESSFPRRISWLKQMEEHGLKTKVAFLDNTHAGFLYIMPIEINPIQIEGKDLMVFPCLVSQSKFSSKGVGKKLIRAAEEETLKQKRKGIVTIANFWNFWFMPAKYFVKLGYKVVEKRGEEALLWKKFDPSAEPPQFRKRNYQFKPIQGKIVVDLFWNVFCLTSDVEAQRVREVVAEYENEVVLNDYSAVNPSIIKRYGISRGIFVNGKWIEIGPEIEKNTLRQEIEKAKIKQQSIK